MTRVKKACGDCGSEEVVKDANAEWDEATQEWVLKSFYDAGYCEVCETEVTIIDVPIAETV